MDLLLEEVKAADRIYYLPLLLLADESEQVVMNYIQEGTLYSITLDKRLIGVALLVPIDQDGYELKNIALTEDVRGMGIGQRVLRELSKKLKHSHASYVIVGTANSSIGNIAFYQKCGFKMHTIKKDFFLKYPEPIYENGIRAIDMIMFKKLL